MRIALHTRLKPGAEAEYEAAHRAVPAELVAAIRAAGATDWTIWRSGLDLFHVIDCDSYDRLLTELAGLPVNIAWQARMSGFTDVPHDYSAPEAGLPVVWELNPRPRAEVVLGGAGYAGLYRAVDEDTAQQALRAAWAAGIRSFDTAPHYGGGLGEERLGRFLRGRNRSEFTVSTKVGRLLYDDPDAPDGADEFYGAPKRSRRLDYSAKGVRLSLEQSLIRLGLDRVDRILVHDPEAHMDQALGEALPELERMRAEGLTAGIGIGVNHVETALRFVRESAIDTVMIAGRYSLLDRRAGRELLPECAERGIQVLVAGVLNSGVLADPLRQATFDYRTADPAVVTRARELERRCAKYGVPLRAAAVQFPRRHPAVTAIVLGSGTRAEIDDSIAMLDLPVPDELWSELEDQALW
ncbi:aldo/keto reductase [Nocardia sp. CA-135398]|uniref:aldo/keto reductase n=1 Tax=Nocardia sp. CA-135398 TaxID=3239977 RepID=UPI003D9845BF